MSSTSAIGAPAAQRRRAYWLKTLHQWHWISSAACLLGMLLFAITGITLNHASQIEARPRTTNAVDTVPAEVLRQLPADAPSKGSTAVPPALRSWLEARFKVELQSREAEWSDGEIYIAMPRPGGDAWLRIARDGGEVEYESTDRGWISYLNDLHKGRHTGVTWSWFIDIFAVACLVFSVTGLFILKMHAGNRPGTWPLVGLGVLLPVLLAILFVH